MLNNQGERSAQPGLKGDSILVEELTQEGLVFFIKDQEKKQNKAKERGKYKDQPLNYMI